MKPFGSATFRGRLSIRFHCDLKLVDASRRARRVDLTILENRFHFSSVDLCNEWAEEERKTSIRFSFVNEHFAESIGSIGRRTAEHRCGWILFWRKRKSVRWWRKKKFTFAAVADRSTKPIVKIGRCFGTEWKRKAKCCLFFFTLSGRKTNELDQRSAWSGDSTRNFSTSLRFRFRFCFNPFGERPGDDRSLIDPSSICVT